MQRQAGEGRSEGRELSERQAAVLRALVVAYLGEAAPVGSKFLAHLLSEKISSASVRNTMGELAALGFVEQPHPSAGRVPTECGLRLFVDQLLGHGELVSYEARLITHSVKEAEADSLPAVASELLTERTRQLGFFVAPRPEREVLRQINFVRLSAERLLVVLVSRSGVAHRRVIDAREPFKQVELDRFATILNERIEGQTLSEVRESLESETSALRSRADRIVARAVKLGVRALGGDEFSEADLVIATRLVLLDQPEFRDPERLRELFAALEVKERLVGILDQMLGGRGASVAFSGELDEPMLGDFALVAAPYGSWRAPLGVLGVIGPQRMDYPRIIPLVEFLSERVTEKLYQ